MFYIKTEHGVKIAVYDLNPGGKDTLFLIHGWPLNHEMFEYQLNVLPKLGFRCIAIDLRGFGRSDAPWSGYSYNRLADDIFTVIREMRLQKVSLLGFSMGGAIAIRYMARHKGYRVHKLVLASTAAPSFVRRPEFPYGQTVDQVNVLIDSLYQDRPQTLTDFGENFFASPITPAFRGWFQRLNLVSASYATIHTAVSLRDEDLSRDLGRIQVPTGIFHGVLDQICPFEFALEMEKGIRRSTLYRFDKSGHGIFYDEKDKFNTELVAFLKQ